jgi:uncharacterized protein (DUF362 family)
MVSQEKPANTDNEKASAGRPTRRDLLVRGGATVLTAGAAAGVFAWLYDSKGDAGLQLPPPLKLKDFFVGLNYDPAAPRIAFAHASPETFAADPMIVERITRAAIGGLHADGIKRFIKKGETVLIKPNVGFDRGPKLGATTNPDVVRAVIRLCLKEAGARKVIVADNPIEEPAVCFAKSGIRDAAAAEGAEVVIHSAAQDREIAVRDRTPDPARNEALGRWPIFWRPLAAADKVIGVAPIKDHNLCYASMTMKNWYGLLGGRRNQFHQAIHDIVSDLGLMMSPTLVIADATRVMMKNGPTGGRVSDIAIGGLLGRPTIVASVDSLACDAWCYQTLLGRDPAALRYLDLAYQKFGRAPGRLVERNWQTYREQGKLVDAGEV